MGDVIKGLFKPKQKNLSKFFYNTLVNVLKFSDEEAKVLMNKYGYDSLDEEEKQYLKENPRTWRVYIDKTVTEEFVVEAYTKDEAEDIARNKSESYSKPDGSEIEDVSVSSSELNRNTYDDDQIEYLEEEVLNV
jgi:hypothetical protein